jgi:hypothetical protein
MMKNDFPPLWRPSVRKPVRLRVEVQRRRVAKRRRVWDGTHFPHVVCLIALFLLGALILAGGVR